MDNVKSLEQYNLERDVLNEGIADFLSSVWGQLLRVVQGEQRSFLRKLGKEQSKNKKVRMLHKRIEDLAQQYISNFSENRRSKNLPKMITIEKNLIQLFKLYETISGNKHKRDVHRKTGLFDRVFLWPELLEKGVTRRDLEEQYQEKVNSIRTRANRKIMRAEEELEYFMLIMPK